MNFWKSIKNWLTAKHSNPHKIKTNKLGKIKTDLESAGALEDFIDNLYYGEHLTGDEAENQIKNNLVSIYCEKGEKAYHSNGLLITDNGYFITCNHCVDSSDLKVSRIYNKSGQNYPIEKICVISKKYELALAKAKIDMPAKAIKFKLYNQTKFVKDHEPVVMFYYDSTGVQGANYGHIMIPKISGLLDTGSRVQDYFVSSVDAWRGCSGGIVANLDGRILGIVSAVDLRITKNKTNCIKTFRVLEMISAYLPYLRGEK